MNCWTVIGGLAGACLLIAFVGVMLVRVYEAGYEQGYVRGLGRRSSGRDVLVASEQLRKLILSKRREPKPLTAAQEARIYCALNLYQLAARNRKR